MNNLNEEENIAKNLAKNIQKDEFKNRNIASIDRIIEHYFNKYNNYPAEEKEVISFLFRYLKEKKEPASILFRHIKNTPEANNIIKKLYYEYRWDFNFDVISSSLFLTSFGLIKTNEILKKALIILAIFIPFLASVSIYSHNKATSLRAEFKEQLDKKSIQLQNEIMNKEKLESELSLLKKNYENDLKTKEQLGSEIVTLKKNLQDEMLNIKQHFENELTSVKEKQQEANELSNCKENLQQEKSDKSQIETELITCKERLQQETDELLTCKEKLQQETDKLLTCEENLQQEESNKSQIEKEKSVNNKEQTVNETKKEKRKIKFDFLKKINRKMLIFFGIDIAMLIFVILYLVFSRDSVNEIGWLFVSFVFEIALNFQFLFDNNSIIFYYCFSVVFILSITILLFVSDRNNLWRDVEYITPFLYITIASTYKYTLIIRNNDFNTISYLIFCLAFVIECITIFIIHYDNTEFLFLLLDEVALFIFYSCIEKSPLFLSNVIFICFLFIEILFMLDDPKYIGALSFGVTLIKYYLFVFVKPDHLNIYIVVFFTLVIEMISVIWFSKKDWVILIWFDACSSLLWINFNVFIFIFISVILIFFSVYAIYRYLKNNLNLVCSIVILLTILTKYGFSIIKFWRSYKKLV